MAIRLRSRIEHEKLQWWAPELHAPDGVSFFPLSLRIMIMLVYSLATRWGRRTDSSTKGEPTGGEFPDARDSQKTGVVPPGWVILHPRRDRWGGMVTGRLSFPPFSACGRASSNRHPRSILLSLSLFLFSTLHRFYFDIVLSLPLSPSLYLSDWNYISISGQPHYFGTHCYLATVNLSFLLYNKIRKLLLVNVNFQEVNFMNFVRCFEFDVEINLD